MRPYTARGGWSVSVRSDSAPPVTETSPEAEPRGVVSDGPDTFAATTSSNGLLPIGASIATSYVAERSWHPSQVVTPLPGGGVELAMQVGAGQELTSWVLSFGGAAEVLEPPALRDAVARELKAALTRYAGDPTAPAAKRPAPRAPHPASARRQARARSEA